MPDASSATPAVPAAAPAGTIAARPLLLLAAAGFASATTLRVADPLLPQVAEEFGASVADASVVATAYTLAYGLCQIVYGPLGDRWGKYATITVATLLGAFATLAAALAGDLATLGLLRLAGGAAAAALIPLAMAYIGDHVPYESRQPVLARFISGQILGIIAGQALGGILGEFLGWRGVFVLFAAVYLVIAALLFVELRSPRVSDTRRPTGLTALVSAYRGLARSAAVRLVLAVVFIEGMLFFGAFTYLGAFLRQDYGFDYATIGLLLTAFGLGALAYTLTAARVVARLGQRGMVLAGGLLLAAGYGLFALVPVWWALIPGVAVCGAGFYLFHNTLQTRATQMAPQARGIAVTLFASALFLGQATGVALAGPAVEAVGFPPLFAAVALLLPALALWFRSRLP
ncbi:MFS transporter [Azospirillum halopraeferens]|uniref:MFS transporter n=1 Tax=Azospirillum halopraeferens TaxID=34010 RepID=UPI0003FEC008|nr:MFS transporter [Azospirillum halopraeferens]